MKLKIKLLRWSAGIPVVMLKQETAEEIGAHAGDRVFIKTLSGGFKKVSTIIDTVTDLIGRKEIAVSSELESRLELRKGQEVDVSLAPFLRSIDFIKKKLNGERLSRGEIKEIIRDVVTNALSDPEIALFVSAMYKNGMNLRETVFLVRAISETGTKLVFNNKYVVDKHSIGGIPGNRTTPIVVSICASAGLIMPKTSSRAITTAAGTADVIETIARVDFSRKELKRIVKKTNACLVWGGALGMVPADERIIKVERFLNIDPEAQLLASIMAKKLAVGSKYILIDIPYGKSAKVNKLKAIKLKKKFEYLGRVFRKKLRCVLTEAKEPMGSGVGPVLEMIDVIEVLDPKQTGPKDLEKKSLFLAGEIFEMTGKAKKGEGIEMAEKILFSGKAFEKFKQIIQAQGGKVRKPSLAKFRKNILAKKSGIVSEINNKKINSFARVAGCPADKSAGLHIDISVKDRVKKGDRLLTIYAESRYRLAEAVKFYKKSKPITID